MKRTVSGPNSSAAASLMLGRISAAADLSARRAAEVLCGRDPALIQLSPRPQQQQVRQSRWAVADPAAATRGGGLSTTTDGQVQVIYIIK